MGEILIKEKILYIEDDEYDRLTIKNFIIDNNLPYEYTTIQSVKESKKILKNEKFDIALIDYKLGDGTAFDVIEYINDIPFIILTGAGDESVATKAMKKGAYDYVIKDVSSNYIKSLPIIIDNSIKRKKAEVELKKYQGKP